MKKMAADEVVWNNLTRILEDESLLDAMKPLRKLKKSVEKAKNAMAGPQESNDTNRNMLKNLGYLLYQADDLLDEILTFKQSTGSGFSTKVGLLFSYHNPLSYPNRMGEQVKRISQKIVELTEQLRYEPGLLRQLPSEHEHQPQTAQNETEHTRDFKLAENKVIGRESDKEEIIKMLLRPKTQITKNVSVIPIFGGPGIGKSTLAKYVYDDKKVTSHFDLKIWIRVSEITDGAEIVREIFESCTNRSNDNRDSRLTNIPHSRFYDLLGCQNNDRSAIPPNDSNSNNEKDIFERRLQKEIEGKLYLLILDDASIKQWLHLKNLLDGGARGSHILVTTKSEDIADLSKSEGVKPHELKGLQKKDGWSLFRTFAFGNTDSPRESNAFKLIGEQIADICKGVPLTIKVAASLLYGKTGKDWESFYKEIPKNLKHEKDIRNYVLEKSYTALPMHLKACLGYCSLFPDDFHFNKHDLISLWTAQGYVDHQVDQSLEDVAEKHFLELSRRCFFEDVITNDLGHILTCKMHRIMRDLACQHTAGAVDMYVNDVKDSRDKQVPDSACKHVSFTPVGDSPTKIAPSLVHAQNLRTLISVKEPDCDTKMDPLVCHRLISRLKCLRVLDFHDLGIEELPVSIGKLIHLRYLDLSKNELITLPKSITELYNLQTLKLNSCLRLKRFSGNFGKLINLRRFEVDQCDSLASMPIGLEKLTQLQTLSRFVVSKDCSTELEVLNKLVNLKGRLEIELSGDWVTNIPEAQETKLQIKNHLEELKISWAKTVSEKSSYLQLLEQLQPTSKLRILCIEGYKGEHFPDWLKISMLSCLPNLEVISIEGCDQCQHLPPFGKLQFLRKLTLRHMANVEYVEGSQEDGREPFFPSLEQLTLHNFYKLEQWQKDMMMVPGQGGQPRSFPCLTKLKMWNCPKMRSMPLFKKVVDLDLRNINQMLLEEFAKASTKKSIINNLQIKECHNLTSFSVVRKGLGGLPVLKQLVVERCDALHLVASELKYLTSLERLEISSCKNLNLSDNDITESSDINTVKWSKIVHLDGLSRNPWRSLKRLLHLNLREILKMETLPEGLKHVHNLRSLWISACPALKALPEWIDSLTALQHLRIENCKSIKTLPDGLKNVKSLMKVEITECPDLLKRCKEHTGEDWHKIKHAQVLLHKSWRYGLMSEQGAQQNRSNVRALTDVKYFIVPVIAAEAVV